MTMFEMMDEFHEAFGHPVGTASFDDDKMVFLRYDLIEEETEEVLVELAGHPVDPAKLTKELADLLYVTIGTATAFGLPLEAAFAEVHRSNMSKLGEDGKPIYREDGKVLKGPNYSPANMEQFFEDR